MRAPFLAFAGVTLLLAATACVTPPRDDTVELAGEQPDISPVLQRPSGRFLKRKVAIARFSNETNYGRSVFLDEHGDTIGKQASDILSARLADSGKFVLLERRDHDKLLEEAERGGITPDLVGADYLILGSVTQFGRATTSETGVFSKTKRQRAYAQVSLRLVDVRTGITIHSDEGRGEALVEVGKVIGIGTGAGYDSTLSERAISAAISRVVSNLAENLLERPWQGAVLGIEAAGSGGGAGAGAGAGAAGETDGPRIVIGGGPSQGIAVGDRFAVLQRGQRFKNPQTGTWVETPGTKIAEIAVVSVFGDSPESEGAMCKLVQGSLEDRKVEELLVQEKKKEEAE